MRHGPARAGDNWRMNRSPSMLQLAHWLRPLAGLQALAIHGAGGGGWEWLIWQRVWRALGASLQAPDLLPVGSGLADTGLEDYCAQMETVARRAAPPVLVGASLGGLIALDLAVRIAAPALILVNPLPPAGIEPRPRSRTFAGDIVPWGRQASLEGTRRALPDADAAAALYALRRWRDESVAVLVQAADRVCGLPRCPVLVIAGADDDDIAPAASAALARRLDADFLCIPGCSHVGPLLGRGAAKIAGQAAAWLARQSLQGRHKFPRKLNE
jgi:pimeloyl-ACP methyl ester carboxylesterase